MFSTPILFLVFNRPDTTKQVFAKIRKIQPKQLFIAADGAREDREDEQEKVEEVRNIILDNIDWDCEVKTLFREKNLGCGKAVSEGITWFFKNVEQGIILEDDTLPDLSFFPFCEELLIKYKDNKTISMISGDNFQKGIKRGKDSYYFSIYTHIWGWASWRRAWEGYDLYIKEYPDFKKKKIIRKLGMPNEFYDYWLNIFSKTYLLEFDTWDYSWQFHIFKTEGITIIPQKNLVKNIGFIDSATHTNKSHSNKYTIETHSIDSCIKHPSKTEKNIEADIYTFYHHFYSKVSLKNNIRNIAYKIFPEVFFLKWRKIKTKLKNAQTYR